MMRRAALVLPLILTAASAAEAGPTRQCVEQSEALVGQRARLVDTAGKVRQVWTIRGFHFEPAWPEFDEAIATGIRSWTYEPAMADGAAVPVCVTVSVNITWK